MADFWKSFNESLARTAVPSFAESLKYGNYQNFLEKQQAQEDETKRRKEVAKAQQAMAEQENENLMISNLLGGKIPEAEKAGYMTNLNDNSLRRYLSIQKSLEPPKQKPLKINYNYPTIHTEDPGTRELKDTGQPNDKYIPKLDKVEGYDKKGEKIMKYINPLTQKVEHEVPTGLFKEKSGDTVIKDQEKVEKNIKYFKGIQRVLDEAQVSKDWRRGEYRDFIHKQRNELEQDIFYAAPSRVQNIIKQAYDDLKKNGYDTPENRIRYQEDILRENYARGVTARANGEIDEQELKLFSLWNNTKFGYGKDPAKIKAKGK